MRILVTGGAGYIGSHIALQLLRSGHDLCVVDDFSNSHPASIIQIKALTNTDFQVCSGDIRDPDLLETLFLDFQPQAVLHLAGKKCVEDSVADPLTTYSHNVSGSLQLLEAMQRHRCRSIVFSSSATVYGQAAYLPFDEDHPRQPISPYGRTKLFTEQILWDWARSCSGASVVALRYFNPAGADPSGLIGGVSMKKPDNLLPLIAQVASGQRPHLTIYGDDYDTRDGTGERDYVHVEDLARAHIAAVEFVTRNTGFEAINLGTGRGTTVLELLEAFQHTTRQMVPHVIGPRRSGDVPRSVTAVQKASRLLNWTSSLGLAEMCQSHWHWHQKNSVP